MSVFKELSPLISDVLHAAMEKVKLLDESRAKREEWRLNYNDPTKWDALREAEQRLETAARWLMSSARDLLDVSQLEDLRDSSSKVTIYRLRQENERYREQNIKLREEVTHMRLGAERRNRELDALHLVWCNGGCHGGVHRYCGKPEDVTEEVVKTAEENTKRLRTWFTNFQYRNKK